MTLSSIDTTTSPLIPNVTISRSAADTTGTELERCWGVVEVDDGYDIAAGVPLASGVKLGVEDAAP